MIGLLIAAGIYRIDPVQPTGHTTAANLGPNSIEIIDTDPPGMGRVVLSVGSVKVPVDDDISSPDGSCWYILILYDR